MIIILILFSRWSSGGGPCRRSATRGPCSGHLGGRHRFILQPLGQDPHAGTLPTEVLPAAAPTLLSLGAPQPPRNGQSSEHQQLDQLTPSFEDSENADRTSMLCSVLSTIITNRVEKDRFMTLLDTAPRVYTHKYENQRVLNDLLRSFGNFQDLDIIFKQLQQKSKLFRQMKHLTIISCLLYLISA